MNINTVKVSIFISQIKIKLKNYYNKNYYYINTIITGYSHVPEMAMNVCILSLSNVLS